MPARRPSLWSEIALALAGITLTTVLLTAGIFLFVVEQVEVERRAALVSALGRTLAGQIQDTPARTGDLSYARALRAAEESGFRLDEAWIVDASLEPVATGLGTPPRTLDDGLRTALYEGTQTVLLLGPPLGSRRVVVTTPIGPLGRPRAALRLGLPLRVPDVPGGRIGFLVGYTVFCAAAIGASGFVLFRRGLVRPVRALGDATSRIAGGDFGHRVQIEAAAELTELATSLNAMAASIERYRADTAAEVARREQANQDLRRAQDALVRSEKLAGTGRLAAGLAHEVGNPLAAVLGYVDLLRKGDLDESTSTELLDRSKVELERIHRILRDLLHYARPGTGIVEEVDPAAALQEAALTVRPTHGFRSIELVVETEPELPAVRIERDKLHQVLVNLLFNAADAVREARGEGAPGRVTLRAKRDGSTLEIATEDDGPGFAAIALDRAFEPFFTTKEPGRGTGLGLATCLQLVEAAGGTITVANRESGGARVVVRLPALERDDAA